MRILRESGLEGAQPTDYGQVVEVPQVVASYATYLHIRTRAEAEISVNGSEAQVSASLGGKTLTLAFGCRKREWSLDRAELRCGEHATTFGRGALMEAVRALLAT